MNRIKKIPIFLLTPNNFAHKAGDGTKTRKRGIKLIHPALQANCGATQATYLLELWENQNGETMQKDKVVCERRIDEGLRTFKGETIGTIRTIDSGGDKRVIENNLTSGFRIRKLTPKECWRLMGFSDESFERARKALNEKFYKGKDKSSSQLYKQAGNSIVTDVLFYIFFELYKAMPYLFDDLKVSSYFSGIGAFEVALNRLFDTINGVDATAVDKSGGGEVTIYDDYNSRVRADQNTIGTLTTNIGSSGLRAAYKIIENEEQ